MPRTALNAMLIAIFLLTCVSAIAEEKANVKDAIKQGLALYEKDKPAEAIKSLQKAIDLIQRSKKKGIAGYLPKAPDGWDAGEVKTERMAMGSGNESAAHFRIKRVYTRKKDKKELTLTLLNAPNMIAPQKQMMTMMKSNPMMLQGMNQDPNVTAKMVDKDGWAGYQTVNKKRKKSEIILMSDAWMLQMEFRAAEDAVIGTFLNATDLKAIAKQTN